MVVTWHLDLWPAIPRIDKTCSHVPCNALLVYLAVLGYNKDFLVYLAVLGYNKDFFVYRGSLSLHRPRSEYSCTYTLLCCCATRPTSCTMLYGGTQIKTVALVQKSK